MNRTAYYVTAIRDHKVAWLAGPYADHGVAMMFVAHVRKVAIEFDPFFDFDAFGTAAIHRSSDDTRPFPNGQLNHIYGGINVLRYQVISPRQGCIAKFKHADDLRVFAEHCRAADDWYVTANDKPIGSFNDIVSLTYKLQMGA